MFQYRMDNINPQDHSWKNYAPEADTETVLARVQNMHDRYTSTKTNDITYYYFVTMLQPTQIVWKFNFQYAAMMQTLFDSQSLATSK